MLRQRICYPRSRHVVPIDFPERLECFKEVSGLSWMELAHRLRVSTVTLWRWRDGGKPRPGHLTALHDLADELGLLHLLTIGTVADGRT